MTTELEDLPELKENQEWCCSNGCGATTPVPSEHEYYREEDVFGNVIERKFDRVWASSCCMGNLLLWDNSKQDFVHKNAEEK